jgi:hypothetical protein
MTLVDRTGCAQCGAALNVPKGKTLSVTFVGSSGKPNARVVVVDGKEIHRCESRVRA